MSVRTDSHVAIHGSEGSSLETTPVDFNQWVSKIKRDIDKLIKRLEPRSWDGAMSWRGCTRSQASESSPHWCYLWPIPVVTSRIEILTSRSWALM